MDLEHRLNELLEESVGDLRPPVTEMVVEANRLGGRRRARRRVQLAGAVVAVAAVATAGTVIGLDRQRPTPAAELTVAAAPKASPSVSASPTPTPTASGPTTDLTWQAMLQILAEEVPPGGTFKNLDTFGIKFNTSADRRSLNVQYNDGQGAVTVMVDMSRTTGGQLTTCHGWTGGGDEGPRRPGNEAPACYEKTLADGTHLMSYITGTDVVGLYDESVVLTRPGGEMLHITAANATLNAYGSTPHITVTRDRPPLGLQGWERVIESPKWQFQVPVPLVDQGAAFAKTVSAFPCPEKDKSQCAS